MATPITSAIALDLGTSLIKAGLLDQDWALNNIVAEAAPEIAASSGRFESDALAYAEIAERVLGECLRHGSGSPPLGLSCQRSSFLIWERASGQPLTPLVSWQDNRGDIGLADAQNSEDMIRRLTGLRLTPYYFAPKLCVVLMDHPEWRLRLENGELLAGTLDTFLIWRWSGGKHYITDASMAARTLLMDTRQQRWSRRLGKLFGIPVCILPRINPSAGLALPLDRGLLLQASLADQSAALIASMNDDCSGVLVNLGTGGFVVRYLPQQRLEEDAPMHGYLRTLVYQDGNLRTYTAIEGTINSLSAALAPYPVRECSIEDLATDDIFSSAEPNGLGAPYFRNDIGICFSRPCEHLAQRQIACLLLEGIIFRVARILEDFHHISPIERVYLSGGLSGLKCLQQGISQCAPCDVYCLPQKDSSLLGAALLASGMTLTDHRKPGVRVTTKTVDAKNFSPLQKKYLGWKNWFDAMLRK